MKICIVIGAFLPVPPARGGAVEKMWYRLALEFARFGHDVLMISKEFDGFPQEEVIDKVRHFRVPGFDTPRGALILKVFDLLYSRRACQAIPSDVDVIVTNTFWAPILVCNKMKMRVYVDVARMPKGQMILYRRAGRLRANSSSVEDAIKAEIPKSQHRFVSKIPNPLPFEAIDIKTNTDLKPCMLYVGRVHPEKGIHLAIAAMRKMQNPWKFRIVGPLLTEEGGDEQYHKMLLSISKGLPIEFAGPIYDIETLNQEYQQASLFLYPSLAERGETFGLAPLEAMAWGCVPVVSDLDCFKDFIDHNVNGLIFDHRSPDPVSTLAAHLTYITSRPDVIQSISERAIGVRISHSPQAIARMFLEDFSAVAKHAQIAFV